MVLYKFSASWCGPCKVMAKKLAGFDACDVVEIDIEEDENEELVEKFAIKSVPTMVLLDQTGVEANRWVGLVDVSEIKKEVEKLNA